MQGKEQIMQMIEGIKGSLAELESALGEGESEMPAEETSEMSGEEMTGEESGAMSPEGEKEEMPPMLKKFMRG